MVSALLSGSGSLDTVWPRYEAHLDDERETAFAREIIWGSLRWAVRLEAILAQLTDRPPRDPLVRALVLTGLYQLGHMRVAEHAAISESVNTVRLLGRERASGFVNAVLRRYQREAGQLEALADETPATRHAYPQWLCKMLQHDWPDDWERLLEAGNERAPMWLRVAGARVDFESYAAALERAAGGAPGRNEYAPDALHPAVPLPVTDLPGFAEGHVVVQDAGAQLAAPLLALQPGLRVLDACAAPGGKSAHILQSQDVQLTAVDSDAGRLERLHENFERLGLEANVVHADAGAPGQWWDGVPFDRILLDAPCSATGVIRRHPDIKLLRRAEDLPHLRESQRRLLAACWSMLAPRGRLVYATCSVLRQENEAVVTDVLRRHADAMPVTARARLTCGIEAGPGVQILTGEAGMDGFYYSCLERA